MSSFKVLPIDEQLSGQIRATLTDPIYGYPVQVGVARPGDYGPCRACLRTFAPGERRILVLYNPFAREQTAEFAGPVFIHDGPCAADLPDGVFPPALRDLPIVLKGYDAQNHYVDEEIPDGAPVEPAIATLFGRPEVAFIHVRNTEAKCFIARIERATG